MTRIFIVLPLLFAAACSQDEGTAAASESASRSAPKSAAIPELPPDGKQLYEFLMREEPKLMAEIPCACCNLSLADCFEGACPET